MKRSGEFILDYSESGPLKDNEFYGFDFFDHDIILFCGGEHSYRPDFGDMTVIGGRSAKPFMSTKLCDLLKLTAGERDFLLDFLIDVDRRFCLIESQNKVVLVSNRLFRSCGLGVAAVFEYSAEHIIGAIKCGMIDRFGDGICSPKLMKEYEKPDSEVNAEALYSLLKCADLLSEAFGEGGTKSILPRIRAASTLIGCDCRAKMTFPDTDDEKTDSDCLAALLLCLFSLARCLSNVRGGSMSVEKTGDVAKLSFKFDMANVKLSAAELECLGFCERLSSKLEMPLSIEASDNHFFAEFAPMRVDPSLCGLKSDCNIVFNA